MKRSLTIAEATIELQAIADSAQGVDTMGMVQRNGYGKPAFYVNGDLTLPELRAIVRVLERVE